jgi:prepilin signal peptidase PulO-like enzyme (type II secretory pathway)
VSGKSFKDISAVLMESEPWNVGSLFFVEGDLVLLSILAATFAGIGLCMGSFASAISARAPAGKSWIHSKGKAERSRCPSCGHVLTWRDLVPLFSWLWTRGKCRYCRANISPVYPALEILGAIIATSALFRTLPDIGVDLVFRILAVPFALALTVMSFRGQRDNLTIGLFAVFGTLASFTWPDGEFAPLLLLFPAIFGALLLLVGYRPLSVAVSFLLLVSLALT